MNFTADEEKDLRESLRTGIPPECPRCKSGLEVHDVEPRKGVPYVRRRVWLVCSHCKRSVVVNRSKTR